MQWRLQKLPKHLVSALLLFTDALGSNTTVAEQIGRLLEKSRKMCLFR